MAGLTLQVTPYQGPAGKLKCERKFRDIVTGVSFSIWNCADVHLPFKLRNLPQALQPNSDVDSRFLSKWFTVDMWDGLVCAV
jgi:hypothetical protein